MKIKLADLPKLIVLVILPLLIVALKLGNDLKLKNKLVYAANSLSAVKSVESLFYPSASWLSAKGASIINEQGEVVILRGVNIGSSKWGDKSWHKKAVKKAVSDWNVNVVRVRMHPEDFTKSKTDFFANLESQFITPAKKQGVYVVLYYGLENSKTDLPTKEAVEMWLAVAKRHKDTPNVLYDLIPEPHDTTKEEVKAAYLDLIPRIREVNPKSLVLVTGLGWGREINSYLKNPLPFKNIVYRTNPYSDKAEFYGLFGQIALKYPVFITEFGITEFPKMDEEDIKGLLKLADQLNLSWTPWHFYNTGCPCLLKDLDSFEPTGWGKLVYEKLQQKPSLKPLPEYKEETDFYIYSDYFHNGFVERGWNSTADLQSDKISYKGKYSISLKFDNSFAGATLKTFNSFTLKEISFLEFYLHFGNNSPFTVKVHFEDENGEVLREIEVNRFMTKTETGWYKVVIPVGEFNMPNEVITGIAVKDGANKQSQEIFIDEIRLF